MDAPVRDRPITARKRFGKFSRMEIWRLAQRFIEWAAIGIIYIVVARFSLTLASINPSATPIWPSAGFALGAVLLRGYRVAPAIFAGAFIVNATNAGSVYTSLGIAAGNTLESLIGAYCIHRWSGGRDTFSTPIGVVKFALVCFAPSSMTSATIGVSSLSLAGYASWPDFRAIWMTWWMGDLAGELVITPVMVLWATTARGLVERKALIQSGLTYAAAVAAGLIAFSPLLEQTPARTPLAFFAILPLMWAAVRRNQRDTATVALLLSCFAVWGTIANGGPFVRDSLNESVLLVLAFMISVSVPSLALSAEVAVRRRHEEHVDFIMHELSHRSKNLLAVIQAMANHSANTSASMTDFKRRFSQRLQGLAASHDLLVQQNWQGGDLAELVVRQLAPFEEIEDGRVDAGGPRVSLDARAVQNVGLLFHELATNASKYGALSVTEGKVVIRWKLDPVETAGRCLRLSWREHNGPRVTPPEHKGFGLVVIERTAAGALNGSVCIDFAPEGLVCTLDIPTAHIIGRVV